jgi:hypothetical protein
MWAIKKIKLIHGIELVRTYLVMKYEPVADINNVTIPERKSQMPKM